MLQNPTYRFSVVVNAATGDGAEDVSSRGNSVHMVLSAADCIRLHPIDQASTPLLGMLLLQMPQDGLPGDGSGPKSTLAFLDSCVAQRHCNGESRL
jgi:hypothetical protein